MTITFGVSAMAGVAAHSSVTVVRIRVVANAFDPFRAQICGNQQERANGLRPVARFWLQPSDIGKHSLFIILGSSSGPEKLKSSRSTLPLYIVTARMSEVCLDHVDVPGRHDPSDQGDPRRLLRIGRATRLEALTGQSKFEARR